MARHALWAVLFGSSLASAQSLPDQPLSFGDMGLARQAAAGHDPAEALARYLRVLGSEPRSLEALTGAGRAALDIGDPNAAISFYARAEEIDPRNGRIKAGLASAMMALVQPKPALKLFDEAIALGVPPEDIAADRGLAFDLRGDNRQAQENYLLALRSSPNDETTRRLAVSMAINGDVPGALARLDPLLRKQDKAAWRSRVFILAISGDVPGAERIANVVLLRPQAEALIPYLQRLPKLRASQQAAAVHFGQFPGEGKSYSKEELLAAAGVQLPVPSPTSSLSGGQEGGSGDEPDESQPQRLSSKQDQKPLALASKPDPRRAARQEPSGPVAKPAARPSVSLPRLIPVDKSRATIASDTAAPASPMPILTVQSFDLPSIATGGASAASTSSLPSTPTPESMTSASAPPVQAPAPVPASVPPSEMTIALAPAAPPPLTPTTSVEVAAPKSKAKIAAKDAEPKLATILRPAEKTTKEPALGKKEKEKAKSKLVEADVKTSKTGKAIEKPETGNKTKQPQRYWVQVATGAYKPDLSKAWGKLKTKYAPLIGSYQPWTTPLNRTNRLMIGPFKSAADAQAFVNKSAGAGFSTAPVTTPAGQSVERVN